jgi:hypothetical protein
MKVDIQMSEKEKRWGLLVLALVLLIVYYINKCYLFILNIEFEDNKATNLTLKTGFIFPAITQVKFGSQVTESNVKFYGYLIKTVPLKDKEGKPDGNYTMEIYRNKNSKKAYKKITINTDDYYVKNVTTPLGKI